MKLLWTSVIATAGILFSISPMHAQQTGLSRGQLTDFIHLKTDFDIAMIEARRTVLREEKPLLDSYELTLIDLKSARGKLQKGKTSMFSVLKIVDKLLKLDLQIASTRGQQTAALLRHTMLLRELEPVAETRADRYLVQFATALAEKELISTKGEKLN